MPRPRKNRTFSLLAALALLSGACGRAPAEEALRAAEAALEAARPSVEKYAPAEIKPLGEALAAAKAQLRKGDYKGAVAAAQALGARTEAAAEAARKRKDELAEAFGALKSSLPGQVQALRTKLAALARNPALPVDMDQETVQTARANLDRLAQAWDDAVHKFERDDVVQAVLQAEKVQAQVEEMARAFLPGKSASASR